MPVQVVNASASSNTFRVLILVTPVNDPPIFLTFDTNDIKYDLASGPVNITPESVLEDSDSEGLAYAEIFIESEHFSPGKDVLIAQSTETIRSIFDPGTGTLVLLGPGTLSEYQAMVRSVQYQFNNDTLQWLYL